MTPREIIERVRGPIPDAHFRALWSWALRERLCDGAAMLVSTKEQYHHLRVTRSISLAQLLADTQIASQEWR